ncbi:MAG TPA: YetF domain-containing protein [Polyangia bacterium]|nr:YetF domain-containing protein [Polyangia bacterium]
MMHMWRPDAPVLALVVRAAIVYVFLGIALRVAGRRELAQMTAFDLVLLLILANALQNSINAGDNSLGGGLISAATLLALNFAVGEAVYRWRWFERLVQGRPLTLVRDGKLVMRNLKRERITIEELRSALRKQSVDGISRCKQAVLESDGTLTAVRDDVTQHAVADLIEK